MTRLFLAAGVAALAIAMPAAAKPGEHGGKDRADKAAQVRGGEQKAARTDNRGGQQKAARSENRGGQRAQAQRVERGAASAPRMERRAFALQERGRGRQAVAVERRRANELRAERVDRREERAAIKTQRIEKHQARDVERRLIRGKPVEVDNRLAERRMRIERIGNRDVRDRIRVNRADGVRLADWDDRDRWDRGFARGLINGCPPGLWMKNNGCLPPGQAKRVIGTVIPTRLRTAVLPLGLRPFYADTDDFYWRYDDGYMYRVDRTSNLIAALLPLIGGGYVPGSMFPTAYSPYYSTGSTFPTWFGNSYVPDYYGWNAFYPDTPFVDYRYLNGNIYGVDPYTGLIEDVIPTYGYGYGIGQMLPAGYGYYNVPYQYRSLYYDTPDYNYWYAPGAIYQYDRSSSLITSIAALLSPGLSIGQQLPMGYDVYNVPYAYRTTYYDTPSAWYRYNNGYIYQVDPTTRLVTAIVASLLT